MLNSCFLRGDAEASTTRLCRSWFKAGTSSGSRGGGPGGLRGDRDASGPALALALAATVMGAGVGVDVLRSAS